MAARIGGNAIKTTSASSSAGTITLSASAFDALSFPFPAAWDGQRVSFRIDHSSIQGEWEINEGVYTHGALTLTRPTASAISNLGVGANADFSTGGLIVEHLGRWEDMEDALDRSVTAVALASPTAWDVSAARRISITDTGSETLNATNVPAAGDHTIVLSGSGGSLTLIPGTGFASTAQALVAEDGQTVVAAFMAAGGVLYPAEDPAEISAPQYVSDAEAQAGYDIIRAGRRTIVIINQDLTAPGTLNLFVSPDARLGDEVIISRPLSGDLLTVGGTAILPRSGLSFVYLGADAWQPIYDSGPIVPQMSVETGATRAVSGEPQGEWISCTNAGGCAITLPDTIVGPYEGLFIQSSASGPVSLLLGGSATIIPADAPLATRGPQHALRVRALNLTAPSVYMVWGEGAPQQLQTNAAEILAMDPALFADFGYCSLTAQTAATRTIAGRGAALAPTGLRVQTVTALGSAGATLAEDGAAGHATLPLLEAMSDGPVLGYWSEAAATRLKSDWDNGETFTILLAGCRRNADAGNTATLFSTSNYTTGGAAGVVLDINGATDRLRVGLNDGTSFVANDGAGRTIGASDEFSALLEVSEDTYARIWLNRGGETQLEVDITWGAVTSVVSSNGTLLGARMDNAGVYEGQVGNLWIGAIVAWDRILTSQERAAALAYKPGLASQTGAVQSTEIAQVDRIETSNSPTVDRSWWGQVVRLQPTATCTLTFAKTLPRGWMTTIHPETAEVVSAAMQAGSPGAGTAYRIKDADLTDGFDLSGLNYVFCIANSDGNSAVLVFVGTNSLPVDEVVIGTGWIATAGSTPGQVFAVQTDGSAGFVNTPALAFETITAAGDWSPAVTDNATTKEFAMAAGSQRILLPAASGFPRGFSFQAVGRADDELFAGFPLTISSGGDMRSQTAFVGWDPAEPTLQAGITNSNYATIAVDRIGDGGSEQWLVRGDFMADLELSAMALYSPRHYWPCNDLVGSGGVVEDDGAGDCQFWYSQAGSDPITFSQGTAARRPLILGTPGATDYRLQFDGAQQHAMTAVYTGSPTDNIAWGICFKVDTAWADLQTLLHTEIAAGPHIRIRANGTTNIGVYHVNAGFTFDRVGGDISGLRDSEWQAMIVSHVGDTITVYHTGTGERQQETSAQYADGQLAAGSVRIGDLDNTAGILEIRFVARWDIAPTAREAVAWLKWVMGNST